MNFNTRIAAQVLAFASSIIGQASAVAITPRNAHTFVIRNPTSDYKNLWFDGASTGNINIQIGPGASEQVTVHSGTSSMRVYEGCTPGNPAAGCGTRLNTVTKLEWTLDGHLGDYINFSMVDGYNAGMTVDFSPDSDCRTMQLSIPKDVVARRCPAANLIGSGQTLTCMSDCKAAEYNHGPSDQYCCEGAHHAHGSCAPSNEYFFDFANAGVGSYMWPHDNSRQQTCNIGGATTITLG